MTKRSDRPPDDTKETSSVVLAAGLSLSRPLRKFLDAQADDPLRAFRTRRRHAPRFCRQYFDLCDGHALECDRSVLEQPDRVLAPARIAVELGENSGDRHLVHRSRGVLAHAHLAVVETDAALDVLEAYRDEAMKCCTACKADWLRRYGDYLVEVRDGAEARRVLRDSLRATESLDQAGRVAFVHGISRYYLGYRDAALEDELRVLESLELTSPRGYFSDAVAILAVFLRGAEPRHDKRVLRHLALFRERLRDVRGFERVRLRIRWVEGQLMARLGDVSEGAKRLDRVRGTLLRFGPLREAVAVTLDQAQIYCRHDFGSNFKTVETMINACLRRLPKDATGEKALLRHGLDTILKVLDEDPEYALDALVGLRSSFVVPVPGLVWERLSTGLDIVLPGRA